MADLVITAADVTTNTADSNSRPEYEYGLAAVTIALGDAVYKDTADNGRWKLADADSPTAAIRDASGIALNAATANQPVRVQKSGDVNLGAILTKSQTYILGDTPGKIRPISDLGVGDYLFYFGFAISSSILRLMIRNTGITKDA